MNTREKERIKQLRHNTTHGGSYVRCPGGHPSVRLRVGRDALGKFLDAWCTEAGCTAQPVRIRDQGRDAHG